MRVLAGLALLAMTMAGCATQSEPASEPIPRQGWCPSWVQGPGMDTHTVRLDAAAPNATTTLRPPGAADGVRNGTGWMHGGHPVDLYHLTLRNVTVAGRLELRAFGGANHTLGVDQGRLMIRDYRVVNGTPLGTLLHVDPSAAGHSFDVLVSSISFDDDAAPSPAHLEWRLMADAAPRSGTAPGERPAPSATLEFTVTYFYRVCGA